MTQQLSRVRPLTEEEQKEMLAQMAGQQAQAQEAVDKAAKQAEAKAEAAASGDALPGFDESDPSTWGNPSRNDPCPCGSGKKFKHCHGRLT